LFPRGCVRLLVAGNEVSHTLHSEERGDEGDQDGCGLQRPDLGHERSYGSSTIENGADTNDPGIAAGRHVNANRSGTLGNT
jgi:hypothetical protein